MKITREKTEKIIGLKDLRENMEKHINSVKKGRSLVVVRRSKPIFKVVPVDELGDDGVWETVVDFTQIKEGGIPAEEVLKALRSMK